MMMMIDSDDGVKVEQHNSQGEEEKREIAEDEVVNKKRKLFGEKSDAWNIIVMYNVFLHSRSLLTYDSFQQ